MKKKLALLAAGLGLMASMNAQWNINGDNSTTGNIAILDNSQFRLRGLTNTQTGILFDVTTETVRISHTKDIYDRYISLGGYTGATWFSQMTLNTKNGYVGIGTSMPNTTLEVNGGIKFGGSSGFNLLTRNATNAYIGQTNMGTEDPESNSGYFFGINPRMGADRLLVIEARTNDGPGAITFNTYSGAGVSRAPERMRLTNIGYLGIGTTTPNTTLEVNGGIKFGGSTGFNLLTRNATNAYIGQTNLGTEDPESNSGYFFGINPRMGADRLLVIEARTNDGAGAITFNTYSGAGVSRAPERMRLTNSGYLGIGTTNPTSPLDVHGTNTRISIGDGTSSLTMGLWDAINNRIESANRPLLITTYAGNINLGPSGASALSITPSGIVGIGTQTPNPLYKLDVAGSIRANEIKVNTTGADFVFEPTYKLRTLAEVEIFINLHKHLPDVAPAAEMQTNGVSMGEMQAKLLQKVEELTLYSIEQEKKLTEQDKAKVEVKEKADKQELLNTEQAKQITELQVKLAEQANEIEQLKQLITQKLK